MSLVLKLSINPVCNAKKKPSIVTRNRDNIYQEDSINLQIFTKVYKHYTKISLLAACHIELLSEYLRAEFCLHNGYTRTLIYKLQ